MCGDKIIVAPIDATNQIHICIIYIHISISFDIMCAVVELDLTLADEHVRGKVFRVQIIVLIIVTYRLTLKSLLLHPQPVTVPVSVLSQHESCLMELLLPRTSFTLPLTLWPVLACRVCNG